MLLTVNIFMSLDGVVQGPGAPDEDRSGGFDRGGWLVPFSSAHTDEVVTNWFREADAFLFGRTSYGLLRGYWPHVTDPGNLIATQLNSLPKYVISSTLPDKQADWKPTTVLRADPTEEVRRLKAQPGRELQVHGSWKLVQTLHRAGLIDSYRVLMYPVIIGTGKRLFPENTMPATLTATQNTSHVLPNGVVALTLTPSKTAGTLPTGQYTVTKGHSTTTLT